MPYSLYAAALLSLLLMALSLNVSRLRMRYRIAFGDGGKPALNAAIRAHGNSLEQSLLFIILLYFLETATAVQPAWVIGLGAAFIGLRLLYCGALFRRHLKLRQLSHALTLLVVLVTTLLLLLSGL
nr:MAPEG family protein [uncultured Pseudomonas sp.]